LKEKIKAAPKELVRRGLDDGTERLRGQLRDTAQHGRADDYGGDQIEDTAAGGARRVERGMESLLKKRKNSRSRTQEGESPAAADPSAPQEPPVERPSPHEPLPREQPKIKTRESVVGTSSDRMVSTALPSGEKPPEWLSIKTKDAYIQSQPAVSSVSPPQAFAQGQREFVQQQGREAAIKRAEVRRIGNSTVPSARGGEDIVPPAPVRQGYASAHPAHRTVRLGNPDAQPVRDGGKSTVKAGRSVQKTSERTARHAIKTAERSSRQTIKTTQRAAKTAARTTKTSAQTAKTAQRTAQATVKATQRAVQAARATAKTAATTAKAAAKATMAAVKAAIAAIQELAAAIAAGGWVVIVIILVICLAGLLIASPFGIFFSDGSNDPDAVSPSAAIVQVSGELAATLSGLQTEGSYDSVEILGRVPAWSDVFAVFAAKTAGAEDGVSVAVLDADRMERLRTVFWDMTKITTAASEVEHPATDDTDAWTEAVLTITITPRTPDDMRVFYSFTDQQNAMLDELLTPENRDMWNNLLYGSSGQIVTVALSQLGNVGGQPYWSWYGFDSRVEWCACFVSWCANECGYIDAGVIPKFAGCTGGSNWFKERGLWQENGYEPRPGDIIFFDWDDKGDSGPQDDVPDHVGIVERVEDGVVYTVEGNSSDSCRRNSYTVGHYEIWGYGTPIY